MTNSFRNYQELINSSTPAFQEKHLILNYRSQQRLIDMCHYQLDYRSYMHVQYRSDCFYDVCDALGEIAKDRIFSILNTGHFQTGRCYCERNTIIVNEHLLLHIEKSNWSNYDLYFEIEEKRSLIPHLEYNEYGKIDHFCS